jgi:hypothetical protein
MGAIDASLLATIIARPGRSRWTKFDDDAVRRAQQQFLHQAEVFWRSMSAPSPRG